MKKIFFATVIPLLAFSSYSQLNPPATKFGCHYEAVQLIIKAEKQKRAAWVCLGGGVVLFTSVVLSGVSNVANDLFVSFATFAHSQQGSTGEAILMIAGAAGIIASVPLFIASGNNKHKAQLLVTSQKASFISAKPVSKNIPGLTLSLAF